MNVGTSPYHAIKALYCRGANADLLSVKGASANQVIRHWDELKQLLGSERHYCSTLPSGVVVKTATLDTSKFEDFDNEVTPVKQIYTIRELQKPNTTYHVGLVSCTSQKDQSGGIAFREWLENFILMETSLKPGVDESLLKDVNIIRLTTAITTLFDKTLRNVASNDEWHIGMGIFHHQVAEFVARGETIRMALPAFPCKSPNERKVRGTIPDMAERVALQTLQEFVQNVKAIYNPGAAIWIVSDGHVFSDCIGVDDDVVCNYDQSLINTYRNMFSSTVDNASIRFWGLTEMFFSNSDANATFAEDWLRSFHIDHPIRSKHMPTAELARKIMMAGFQSSREHFRKLVTDQHPATLSLYRGQARFMQDDLACPDFLSLSAKQKKKLSFIVASEMIARNQAYSNMLELLLPTYIRLSIHAHSNRGPKFAICLLPRTRVRAIDTVANRHELSPSYEFQVPTPWHNSIIVIDKNDMLYLGKAEIVQKALDSGDFEGGWVDDQALGGHFRLRPTIAISNGPSLVTGSTSTVFTEASDEKPAAVITGGADEILTMGSPRDVTQLRLTAQLRAKVYRILELSRTFVKRASRDQASFRKLRSGQRGVSIKGH